MALKSLKQTDEHGIEYTPRAFGYGTEIYLNGEQCEALGLTRIAAGQTVTIRASGIVTRATEELEMDADSGGKDLCISIQLTEADVTPVGTANAARAARILYGASGDEE